MNWVNLLPFNYRFSMRHKTTPLNLSLAKNSARRNRVNKPSPQLIHGNSSTETHPQQLIQSSSSEMPSATPPDHSPSPPPQAPIASTPGPRAVAFIDLYNRALSNTLSSISYSTFSECFPLIAAQAPQALKAMHESVVSRLGGFAREEFEVIMREREVVARLNELEERIGEGRRRKARGVEGEIAPVP